MPWTKWFREIKRQMTLIAFFIAKWTTEDRQGPEDLNEFFTMLY